MLPAHGGGQTDPVGHPATELGELYMSFGRAAKKKTSAFLNCLESLSYSIYNFGRGSILDGNCARGKNKQTRRRSCQESTLLSHAALLPRPRHPEAPLTTTQQPERAFELRCRWSCTWPYHHITTFHHLSPRFLHHSSAFNSQSPWRTQLQGAVPFIKSLSRFSCASPITFLLQISAAFASPAAPLNNPSTPHSSTSSSHGSSL